ncbi:hypothetical protein C8A05DRAFT_37539 [Staphylotrichum tortipilum]|uniref:2EXR domain-containing protein n=1 Tax=Staphylotrichum tortipilum TaxID=2831512 RepID=A0AAN6RQ44_9PEZI|nr:hypothetical protein C8A05DRAFT_37539 [Staphylotrichum longicolle]
MVPSPAPAGNASKPPKEPTKLYNDVHFTNPVLFHKTWYPFQRLPPELRGHIWTAFLRDRRMIELDLYMLNPEDATDDGPDAEQTYVQQNHLGNVISGRGYCLEFCGGFGTTISPLLWVNRESRAATRRFYRVHLPLKHKTGLRVLYLSPEYDLVVTHLRPGLFTSLLPDFLHDIRAYDTRDRGLAHLAVHDTSLFSPTIDQFSSDVPQPLLHPDNLHPTARASFADIIQRRLRSLLLMVDFRTNMRGIGQTHPSICYHFAQTFPLRPRGAKGARRVDWLETDPRLGVEHDLANLPLLNDPNTMAAAWRVLETKFGVTRPTYLNNTNKTFQLYICPSLSWPRTGLSRLPPPRPPTPPAGSREELELHLREEEGDWRYLRQFHWDSLLRFLPGATRVRRHGVLVDAATFERMERACSTAVGMWVFPAEAFENTAKNGGKTVFDVRAVRPGLVVSRV